MGVRPLLKGPPPHETGVEPESAKRVEKERKAESDQGWRADQGCKRALVSRA